MDESLLNKPYDLQGWNSNDPMFEELIERVKPTTIIEVGSWKGASALHMARLCKARELSTKIYCVDTWLGSLEHMLGLNQADLEPFCGYPTIYYQFWSNVVHDGFENVITPVPQTSLTAAKYFSKRGVLGDLVYVDAGHEYDDVIADISAYWPLVREGGYLFGDDYKFVDGRDCWPGVTRAVDTFAAMYDLKIERSTNKWAIKKVRIDV